MSGDYNMIGAAKIFRRNSGSNERGTAEHRDSNDLLVRLYVQESLKPGQNLSLLSPDNDDPSRWKWNENFRSLLPPPADSTLNDQHDRMIADALADSVLDTQLPPEVRTQAVIELQHAPLSESVAKSTIQRLAASYGDVYTDKTLDPDEKLHSKSMIIAAFASVGSQLESSGNGDSNLAGYRAETLRDLYAANPGNRNKATRESIRELSSYTLVDSRTGAPFNPADRVDVRPNTVALNTGRIAVSVATSGVLLAPTVAAATPNTVSSANLSPLSQTAVTQLFEQSPAIGTEIPIGTPVQSGLATSSPDALLRSIAINSSVNLSPLSVSVASAGPKLLSPEMQVAALAGFNSTTISEVATAVAKTNPHLDTLTGEQMLARQMLEDIGQLPTSMRTAETINSEADTESLLSKELLENVMSELKTLESDISSALARGRMTPYAAEQARFYMDVLKKAAEDKSALSLLTNEEREAIVAADALGTLDLVNSVIEHLPDDSAVLEWSYALGSGDEEGIENDGLLALTMYAGIHSRTLDREQIDEMLGFDDSELTLPEFIDTRIDTQPVFEGEVTRENFRDVPNELRKENLRAMIIKLNEEAIANPMGYGMTGWHGDIDELVELYWKYGMMYNELSVTPEILAAQGFQESRFSPNAVSYSGYEGLGQLGDAAIADYQRFNPGDNNVDPFNPEDAIKIHAWYNAHVEQQGAYAWSGYEKVVYTLAGYNAGYGHVLDYGPRLIDERIDFNSAVETQARDYVQSITGSLDTILANLQVLVDEKGALADSAEQKAKMEDLGFTREARNLRGEAEYIPISIDDGKVHAYFSQSDPKFKIALEKAGFDDGDLGNKHMCGVFTLAMTYYSHPDRVPKSDADVDAAYLQIIEWYTWARENNIFTNPDGGAMYHEGIRQLGEHMGLKMVKLRAQTTEELSLATENGAEYVIMNTNPDKAKGNEDALTQSGHIFSFRGFVDKEKGIGAVLDPASFTKTQKTWTVEQLLKYGDQSALYAVDLDDDIPYEQIIADDIAAKEKAEQEARDQAEREAKEKAEEQAEADKKAAEEAENQRKERERQNQGRVNNEWDPRSMGDGWKNYLQIRNNYPEGQSGKLSDDELRYVGEDVHDNDFTGERSRMNPEAANALNAMIQAAAKDGIYLQINDTYRDFNAQWAIAGMSADGTVKTNGNAAWPGYSPHGLGNAADINAPLMWDDPAHDWIVNEGWKFGFFNPEWMDVNHGTINNSWTNDGLNEPWHYEYFGTSPDIIQFIDGHHEYKDRIGEIAAGLGLKN